MREVVKSSSHSRVKLYEKCPRQFKLKHVDKIPDPAPELPPGQERPKDRGIRIHTFAEHYVKNPRMEAGEEIQYHVPQFNALRKAYERGLVKLEESLAFDADWNPSSPTDFENTIFRMVADVRVNVSDKRILVIDHKSGKKDGNEIAHHDQLMEYSCCYALVMPHVEVFDMQIWYLDQPADNIMKKTFTRSQVMRAFPRIRKRHEDLLKARIFPERPSQFSCMFCPYKAGMVGRGKFAYAGTGHCRSNVC